MKNKLNIPEINYLLHKIDNDLDNINDEMEQYRESGEFAPHELHAQAAFLYNLYAKLMDQKIKSK